MPDYSRTLTTAIVAGRYKLERQIARGGMGTVWLGGDLKLGRRVAIKVMAKELSRMSEAHRRFEREALAVAQLHSTHVVELYDYGVQEDLPYIVMELLEGESLSARLKRVGRIGLRETAVIIKQVCKGLKVAHAAGLVHRDLKPSNVFIARRDDEELVKLLDFGVVKAVEDAPHADTPEHTATGILLGTPQYMSPEQARALRDIDHRSDLWAVGVLTFRMLTGSSPFRGPSVGDVVLKICSDELPRVRDAAPDVPASLDAFFARAFQRSVSKRFQSADELAATLSTVVAEALGDTTLGSSLIVGPASLTGYRPPSSDARASLTSLPSLPSFGSPPTPSAPGTPASGVPVSGVHAGPEPPSSGDSASFPRLGPQVDVTRAVDPVALAWMARADVRVPAPPPAAAHLPTAPPQVAAAFPAPPLRDSMPSVPGSLLAGAPPPARQEAFLPPGVEPPTPVSTTVAGTPIAIDRDATVGGSTSSVPLRALVGLALAAVAMVGVFGLLWMRAAGSAEQPPAGARPPASAAGPTSEPGPLPGLDDADAFPDKTPPVASASPAASASSLPSASAGKTPVTVPTIQRPPEKSGNARPQWF